MANFCRKVPVWGPYWPLNYVPHICLTTKGAVMIRRLFRIRLFIWNLLLKKYVFIICVLSAIKVFQKTTLKKIGCPTLVTYLVILSEFFIWRKWFLKCNHIMLRTNRRRNLPVIQWKIIFWNNDEKLFFFAHNFCLVNF